MTNVKQSLREFWTNLYPLMADYGFKWQEVFQSHGFDIVSRQNGGFSMERAGKCFDVEYYPIKYQGVKISFEDPETEYHIVHAGQRVIVDIKEVKIVSESGAAKFAEKYAQ